MCSGTISLQLCFSAALLQLLIKSVNFRTRSLLSNPKCIPTVSASKSTFSCHNINNHHYLQLGRVDRRVLVEFDSFLSARTLMSTSCCRNMRKLKFQARNFSACFEYNGFVASTHLRRFLVGFATAMYYKWYPFILLCNMFSNLISISKPRQL